MSKTMTATKVMTRGGRAQWRIDDFGPTFKFKQSEPFEIGIWNWYLSLEKKEFVYVRLFPESSRASKEPPLVRFLLSVTLGDDKKVSTFHEGLLRTRNDFVFPVRIYFETHLTYNDFPIHSQYQVIIDVEFWDLKISPLDGGKAIPVWPSDDTMKPLVNPNPPAYLSRMLNESVLTDITINTSDGKLLAHRAVLSASSPVFHSMFVHDLEEKQSSTINIEDMTSETGTALLSYMYGSISQEEFWKQRLALVAVANKYDISDLKDACEESLLEDIKLDNVFERLEAARLYRLDKLKKQCVACLIGIGTIHDHREKMDAFFKRADKELVVEMLQEVFGCLHFWINPAPVQ